METSTILKIAAVSIALLVFLVCKYYWKLPANNPIEQAAEEVIKDETGIDLITTSTQQEEKQ